MSQYVIDTADLGSEQLQVGGVFPPGVLEIGESVRQAGDVEWSGSIVREHDRIRFRGSLKGVLELACDRCLDPSRTEITSDFDLFFEPRDSLAYEEDAEIELGEPDMRTAFLAGSELDVGDVITEQLLLALPMKPLCRDDCRGLCPQCGQNLNVAECDCKIPVIHPAFSVLEDLKEQMESRD